MNDLMTFDMAARIITAIQYRDWNIRIHRPRGGFEDMHAILRFDFDWQAPDATAPQYELAQDIDMHSTGHFISAYMDETQILRRVFHAIRIAEDHETREFFRYRDVQVFDPHKPNTL